MRKNSLIQIVVLGLLTSTICFSAEPEQVNRGLNRSLIKKMNTTDFTGVIADEHAEKFGVAENIPTPKQGRLQASLNLAAVQTDSLYSSVGAGISLNYHLTETWGLGLSGTAMSGSKNGQAANLSDIQLTDTDVAPRMKSYNAAYLVITPFYGKWSFANTKIVSWDFYIHLGGADIKDQNSNSSSAILAGLGQLFSLSENSALDVGLQSLQYKIKDINAVDYHRNDINLIVGYSYFFPKLK